MLEVRCGKANRSHENTFFRYFASEIKAKFDGLGVDGLLLGMPYCLVKENLQLDALLITDASITIIDFKDYSDCSITLPAESDFERGRWATDQGFFIKGGSSPNPFSQQQFQRRALRGVFDIFCRNKMADFDIGHITSVVCFTGNVKVIGNIPGRNKLTFSIADADSFIERLYDFANIRGVGLLKSEFVCKLLDKLFDTDPYECAPKPSRPDPIVQPTITEPENGNSFGFIKRFFTSDEDVLIMRGTDPAKRMDAAIIARRSAHGLGFIEAKILSSTKLAGDNLCSSLDVDGSLYSEIYDFASHEHDDAIDMDRVPLAKRVSLVEDDSSIVPSDGENQHQSVFVICESQLVSNSLWATGSALLGSGHLLSDTLEFLGIDAENRGANKLVVIGDEFQLGANSLSDSSLHVEAYPADLRIVSEQLPSLEASGPIDEAVCELSMCLQTANFSLLSLTSAEGGNQIVSTDADERFAIEDAVENWHTHKIITSTNAQAHKLNNYIKRTVVRNGESLAPGDILVMNEQIEAVVNSPLSGAIPVRRIRNGEFVKVVRVDPREIRLDAQDGESKDFLTIVRVSVLPEGCHDECEIALPLEYLYSDKGELSRLQEIAVKAHLAELERTYRDQHPFSEGNPLFDEMIREGKYEKLTDENGSVRYRSSADKRRLTPQEKEYRKKIRLSLSSPGTEYYSLSNLAKSRFGWAVTAHKARSYRWDEITISANAEMGKNTDAYFRYLYTGFSRAISKLNIMRWKDVSPFSKTIFDDHPINVRKKSARRVIGRENDPTKTFETIQAMLGAHCLNEINLTHKASSAWSESFFVSCDNEEAVIVFDRNKAGDIFAPRLERGSANLLARITEALSDEVETPITPESPMTSAYKYLCARTGGKMKISTVKVSQYRDDILVEFDSGSFFAAVYYDAGKMISKIEFQSGDVNAFRKASNLAGGQG